ncbi:hypothetical protein ES703_32452 [subsurface metagenome]
MLEPLNVERVLEVIGYDDDPATVIRLVFGLGFLAVHRSDGHVRYYKTILQPGGAIKLTNQDITWDIEWENLMNEGGCNGKIVT